MTYTVLTYLEKSAETYPQKEAVVDEAGSCTYAELLERSRRAGSFLAAKLKKGEPIPVFMEKGTDALCAFLGIAYAGGAYCLVNPELPRARLLQIQQVLEAGTVVTTAELAPYAAEIFPEAEILLISALKSAPVDEKALEALRQAAIDTDPLYINFTSGSTGIPKGILVSHRSVLDFISCFTELFHITAEDRIANQAPFDFDVSVKDIYSALKTGATLVIVPRRLFSAPIELIDFLCVHRVTTMIWAVSALCLISTFHGLDYKTPETVRKILFSGEVMPYKHLQNWKQHLPKAVFVNLYGPTEITCNCTYHILEENRDYAAGIPIGRPFPNEDVFLLTPQNRRVSREDTQSVGEICVRGTALALGYYRSPQQNAAHFVQNPLNLHYPETVYRTGDLGRYDENGELIFAGRKDFQIKYMGHRIELEEIERAMAAVEGVERSCCIFDEKHSRLKGYYVGSIEKEKLHTLLRESLPAFMIPGLLRKIDRMPLTKNGKIDRKRLEEA